MEEKFKQINDTKKKDLCFFFEENCLHDKVSFHEDPHAVQKKFEYL